MGNDTIHDLLAGIDKDLACIDKTIQRFHNMKKLSSHDIEQLCELMETKCSLLNTRVAYASADFWSTSDGGVHMSGKQ